RVRFQGLKVGRLELHGVVRGIDRGQDVGGIAVADNRAEGAGLSGRNALYRDLHLLGVFNLMRLGGLHAGESDVLLPHVLFQTIHGLVGVRFDSVLNLDLELQVAAPLEVQPEPDVVIEVLDQFRLRGGDPDNAVDAKQYRYHDNYGPRRQIL